MVNKLKASLILGKLIAEARTSVGITAEELGERLGVSKVAVSQWENGRSISLDRASEVLEALGYEIVISKRKIPKKMS